jgi:hypothetical protein
MKSSQRTCRILNILLLISLIERYSSWISFSPLKSSIKNVKYHHRKTCLNAQPDLFQTQIAHRLNTFSLDAAIEVITKPFHGSQPIPKHLLFPSVELYPFSPTPSRFIIANPNIFLFNERIAKSFGCSIERLFLILSKHSHEIPKFQRYLMNPAEIVKDLSVLSLILPVIYILEQHEDFGILGLQLNSPAIRHLPSASPSSKEGEAEVEEKDEKQGKGENETEEETEEKEETEEELAKRKKEFISEFATMFSKGMNPEQALKEAEDSENSLNKPSIDPFNENLLYCRYETVRDAHPYLTKVRNKRYTLGGHERKGVEEMMIHRRKDNFPANRIFYTHPMVENQGGDHTVYFSPEVAYANDLCLTNDARPEEFRLKLFLFCSFFD